jgi:hypothetical protein
MGIRNVSTNDIIIIILHISYYYYYYYYCFQSHYTNTVSLLFLLIPEFLEGLCVTSVVHVASLLSAQPLKFL